MSSLLGRFPKRRIGEGLFIFCFASCATQTQNLIRMQTRAETLIAQIEEFLAASPRAVAVENGEVIFRFCDAHHSLLPERDRCVFQIWSEDRNLVRRVMAAEPRNGSLRLQVHRFGQSKPSLLELCSDDDRRSPSAKKAMRAAYQRVLRRVLERNFPGAIVEQLTVAPDLERSFGPVHVRGVMKQGTSTVAIIGVSASEPQASVDAALTTGILWLQHCRERLADRRHVEGLRVIAPAGRTDVLRLRMANLHREAARWELFELDEMSESLAQKDASDAGNFATRLVQLPDHSAALERFRPSIERIMAMVPRAEVVLASAGEVSFRLCGLEFARARVTHQGASFQTSQEITFGCAGGEIPLNDETEPMLRDAAERLVAARLGQDRTHTLYRVQPERWLESVVMKNVGLLDERIDTRWIYSQVPAFASSDRAMIDLLTVTRDGRLVVIELKASEDMHLPLQGLDYWARVRWHHQRGEFQKFGYFRGCELSDRPPILLLVSPALHLHPATDTLLRFLSPEVEWKLLGIDEHWRWGVRVVFRKSRHEQHVETRG